MTRRLLDLLRAGADDDRLETWLANKARTVVELVPECVGITIALVDEQQTTFTYLATSAELGVVDGAQYLAGGPCEQAVREGNELHADLLGEEAWHFAALAGAAVGVRSTLSLPLRARARIAGSVNLYGAGMNTFAGNVADLARIFGAVAEDAVANADLSMSGVDRAQHSAREVEDASRIDVAVGYVAARQQMSVDEARRRLQDAADRAGVPAAALARAIVGGQTGREG